MGWFLRLMEELAIECRVGHPTAIRKAETRRQKHDRRDAALLLQLLAEDRFPTIWMPSTELRDLRALLLHRHQWVRMRTRVQNALHAIALAHGRGHRRDSRRRASQRRESWGFVSGSCCAIRLTTRSSAVVAWRGSSKSGVCAGVPVLALVLE